MLVLTSISSNNACAQRESTNHAMKHEKDSMLVLTTKLQKGYNIRFDQKRGYFLLKKKIYKRWLLMSVADVFLIFFSFTDVMHINGLPAFCESCLPYLLFDFDFSLFLVNTYYLCRKEINSWSC